MDITITVSDEQLDRLAELIAAKMRGTVEPEPEDLAGGGEVPEEKKKTTLTDVQDAIRAAGAIDPVKTKAVLARHVPKGREPRGTNLEESKFDAVIAELAKIKK